MKKQPPISIEDAEKLIIEICDRAGIQHNGGLTVDECSVTNWRGKVTKYKLLKHFEMELRA